MNLTGLVSKSVICECWTSARYRATSLVGQTTLRSILGQFDLDHLLTERDRINQRLQEVIDQQTSTWGVKVISVEVHRTTGSSNATDDTIERVVWGLAP